MTFEGAAQVNTSAYLHISEAALTGSLILDLYYISQQFMAIHQIPAELA